MKENIYIYHSGAYTVPTQAQLYKLEEKEGKQASKQGKKLASAPGYMPGTSPAVLKAATVVGTLASAYRHNTPVGVLSYDGTITQTVDLLEMLNYEMHKLACLIVFKKLQAMRRKDATYTADIDGLTTGTAVYSKIERYLYTLDECDRIMSSAAWACMPAYVKKDWRLYKDDTMKALASVGRENAAGLVSAAKEKIWEIIRAADRAGMLTPCVLVKECYAYDERTTKHADGTPTSSEKWSIYRTSGIRLIGAAVSVEMRENRSAHDSLQAWQEVERTAENGTTYTTYTKVSVIGATCAGFDDDFVQNIAEKCNLTATENAVLTMHYCGAWYNGHKDTKTGKTIGACMRIWTLAQIAEHRGLSLRAVELADQRLKEKIVKSGYFARKIAGTDYEPKNNVKKSRKIGVYMLVDENKEIFATFASIGAAAKILDISKGGISDVVNGKKASVKGMVFIKVD